LEKGESNLEKKAVSGIMLTLLLMGMLTLAFHAQPVKASETIYIRADGSIDPPTAPIQRNVDLYALTDNIYASFNGIVIQRNNMTLDGAGFMLEGTGSYTGILVEKRSNVTIKRMEIEAFYYGIYFSYSTKTNLVGNNITNNGYGVYVHYSNGNFVGNNIITKNTYGIYLYYSSKGDIVENNVTIASYGIYLYSFLNSTISRNNITNSGNGITLLYSSNNTLRSNNMTNNDYNFGVYGNSLSQYGNDVDSSNTINGKPIYYWIDRRDIAVPSDAGYVALVNCTNIEVKNLNLQDDVVLANTTNSMITQNNVNVIELFYSSNNSLTANNIGGGHKGGGIGLSYSSNNTITRNNVTAAYGYGISHALSSDNRIYHNNFFPGEPVLYVPGLVNVWDDGYPSGGNYWSDITGVDLYSGPNQDQPGSDGISDTPLGMDERNRDNYPLMAPWPTRTVQTTVNIGGVNYTMTTQSNATITHAVATKNTLHFTASGSSGSTGYVRTTFPIGVNATAIKVFINGVKLTPPPFPIITSNGTHYLIYFEFTLSTHNITIQYAIADIATTNITPAKTVVGQGYTIRINATIQNQGDYEETFNVTLYSNSALINDTGLVCYWKFDEGSGVTAHDSTGNGNDETLYQGLDTGWTTGKFGKALKFDGINDYAWSSGSPQIDITDAITIMAWVNPQPTTSFNRIITKGNEHYVLRLPNMNQIHFYMNKSGTLYHTRADYGFEAGKWYHVTATWAGNTDPYPKLYVNSEPVTLTQNDQVTPPIESGNTEISISGPSSEETFNGTLDEIKIYNRALSKAEIWTEYRGAIQTQAVTLESGASKTLTFAWNTTGVARGNYTVSAVADQVPDETDTTDNTCTCWILITKAGDFGTISGGYYDFDDQCDYQDLFLFRKAYVEAYQPLCDFDNDNDVDYKDLFQFRKCYIAL